MAHYVVYARSYKDSTDTLFPVIIFCHGFAIDIFLQKVTLDDSGGGAACAVRAQALYDKGGNNAESLECVLAWLVAPRATGFQKKLIKKAMHFELFVTIIVTH